MNPGPETAAGCGRRPDTILPGKVTAHFASLARSNNPRLDPLAAQFVPRPELEAEVRSYESADPLADDRYRVAERLIHHYPDRALLLTDTRCAMYCRFCFRRHFAGREGGPVTPDQMDEACDYLARHPQIREILLSGGDPLMLSDETLEAVIRRLRAVRAGCLIRVCTRRPVVDPARVTDRLAEVLGRSRPLWAVLHLNHPWELAPAFQQAAGRLAGAGVPMAGQTVLLRGINDDPDVLEALFRGMLGRGIRPYYLFQGDLAAGTSHFRVDVGHGLELMKELRCRMGGLGLPVYAVDLPGGAGKVPVESHLLRREAGAYVFKGLSGGEHRYPAEPSGRSGA